MTWFEGSTRRIALRLLLSLGTVLVLLIILEIGTRVFTDIQPSLRIRDVAIGQKYRSNWTGEIDVTESRNRIPLRFHRDGFRGENRPYEKPPGTCRIAIIGDSQIAAIPTPEEETVVHQLERVLQENHSEITWEVFNFGVSAASTGQESVLYRKLVTKYDPDIVICAYYIGNDFSDNCSRLDSNPRIYMRLNDRGELEVEPYLAARKKLSVWLNTHSRFYVWQKHKFKHVTRNVADMGTFYEVRAGNLVFMNKDSEDLNYAWKLNEAIIDAFRNEVVGDGRQFLLVFIPTTEQLHEDTWDAFFARDESAQEFLERSYPNRRLSEIVARNEIDHLFLQDVLDKHIAGRPHDVPEAQVLYRGIGHLNPTGHLLSARMIYDYLLENDTISRLVAHYESQ